MKLLLTIFCLLFISETFGQIKKIKTIDFSNKEYYLDITFLSEGEFQPQKTKNRTENDIAFRVVILTSEIYNTLVLEKVSYGSEGGNKHIINKRKVDLSQIWTEFKLTGEITDLEFIKWLTWDSFEIKIQELTYIFKNISLSTIDVQRKKASS